MRQIGESDRLGAIGQVITAAISAVMIAGFAAANWVLLTAIAILAVGWPVAAVICTVLPDSAFDGTMSLVGFGVGGYLTFRVYKSFRKSWY